MCLIAKCGLVIIHFVVTSIPSVQQHCIRRVKFKIQSSGALVERGMVLKMVEYVMKATALGLLLSETPPKADHAHSQPNKAAGVVVQWSSFRCKT